MHDTGKLARKLGFDRHDEATLANRDDVVLNGTRVTIRAQDRADAVARVVLRLRQTTANTSKRGRRAIEDGAALIDCVGERALQIAQVRVARGDRGQRLVLDLAQRVPGGGGRRERIADGAQIAGPERPPDGCRFGECTGINGGKHVQIAAGDQIAHQRGAPLFEPHQREVDYRFELRSTRAPALGMCRRHDPLAHGREIERRQRALVGQHYGSSFCFISVLTSCGSALPALAFIT